MSLDMSAELRAIDLRDADRDENTHYCDFCGLPGALFADGFWLCAACSEAWFRKVEKEAYAR